MLPSVWPRWTASRAHTLSARSHAFHPSPISLPPSEPVDTAGDRFGFTHSPPLLHKASAIFQPNDVSPDCLVSLTSLPSAAACGAESPDRLSFSPVPPCPAWWLSPSEWPIGLWRAQVALVQSSSVHTGQNVSNLFINGS